MGGPKNPDTGRAGTILQSGGMAALREGRLTSEACSSCDFDLTRVIKEGGRCCVNCGAQIPGKETTVHVDLGAPGPGAAPPAPVRPTAPSPAPHLPQRAGNPVWELSAYPRSGTIMELQKNGWGHYAAILFLALTLIALLAVTFVIIREKMATPVSDAGSAPLQDVNIALPPTD